MISIIIPTIKSDLGSTLWSIKKRTKDYEIITSGLKGYNTAINDAVSRAKGDYLIFLHDDVIVTTGWADKLSDCGAFKIGEMGDRFEIWGGFYPDKYEDNPEGSPDYSFFVCLSKEVVKKVFPLDEKFTSPWCQDVDFGFTIKKAGYKLECLPGKIIHEHQTAVKKNKEENEKYLKRKWKL